MKNFWQPSIDNWAFKITENVDPASINNTTSFPTSYKYAPQQEQEERQINVNGVGSMSLKELKNKINEILTDLSISSKNNNISDFEKIYHTLVTDPKLTNMIKEYINNVKKGSNNENGSN